MAVFRSPSHLKEKGKEKRNDDKKIIFWSFLSMIYGTFSRLNVAKGVERWGKGLIYLKLSWGIDSSCSNDRPFLWVKSAVYISCHLQLLAAYCCFSQRGYQKHGVTRGALLDITVIGCTLADSAGELADFSIYFPFFPRMKRSVRVNEACLGLKKTVWYEKEGERESFYNTRDFLSVWYTTLCVVGLGWNEQFLKEQGQSVWKYPDVSAVLCFSFFPVVFSLLAVMQTFIRKVTSRPETMPLNFI